MKTFSWGMDRTGVVGVVLCLWASALIGCSRPNMEIELNASTEAFPVSTRSGGGANGLAGIGEDPGAAPLVSMIRIPMAAIADEHMEEVHLTAFTMIAQTGDLSFVGVAKCYLDRSARGQPPLLLAEARHGALSDDQRSLRLEIRSDDDLVQVLRGPFEVWVEIEGGAPSSNTSISAELNLRAIVRM